MSKTRFYEKYPAMNDQFAFLSPIAAELSSKDVPKAQPKITPSDIDLLYNHLKTPGIENIANEAYWDKVAGVWTVGVGQTGNGITKGTKWTDEQIRADFDKRAMANRAILEQQYGTVFNSMTDKQKMVVQSLLWNAGPAALDNWPKMRAAMMTTDKAKVADAIRVFSQEIPTIRKSGGKVVKGLENRRAIEKKMFDEQ